MCCVATVPRASSPLLLPADYASPPEALLTLSPYATEVSHRAEYDVEVVVIANEKGGKKH